MTDREKIIKWVKKSEGTIVPFSAPDGLTFGVAFTAENLECFVKIIQAEAFERADKACEALRCEDGDGQHNQWYVGIDSCREEIRALKEK